MVFTRLPDAMFDTANEVVVALVRRVRPESVEDAALKARVIVEEPKMVSAVPVAFWKAVEPKRVEEAEANPLVALRKPP